MPRSLLGKDGDTLTILQTQVDSNTSVLTFTNSAAGLNSSDISSLQSQLSTIQTYYRYNLSDWKFNASQVSSAKLWTNGASIWQLNGAGSVMELPEGYYRIVGKTTSQSGSVIVHFPRFMFDWIQPDATGIPHDNLPDVELPITMSYRAITNGAENNNATPKLMYDVNYTDGGGGDSVLYLYFENSTTVGVEGGFDGARTIQITAYPVG